jgi:hypothetical protein
MSLRTVELSDVAGLLLWQGEADAVETRAHPGKVLPVLRATTSGGKEFSDVLSELVSGCVRVPRYQLNRHSPRTNELDA